MNKKTRSPLFHITKRDALPWYKSWGIRAAAILLALIVCSIITTTMTGENPLDMGPTEFKLLHFFMTHPERVYSREQLLNHVWGTNVYVEDRTVDVHIRRLRKALEHSGHDRMVQTVRGTGYRFSARF